MADMDMKEQRILFFDGHCNLCNAFIDFMIRRNKKGKLKFAALQSETARDLVDPERLASMNTILFYQDGKFFSESEAVLRALIALGGIWKLAYIDLMVPAFIRDPIYRWVAQNRFFGQRKSCRVPGPEDCKHLLP